MHRRVEMTATNRPSERRDMRTRAEQIASLDVFVMVTPAGALSPPSAAIGHTADDACREELER
jgi:hypothetical protein